MYQALCVEQILTVTKILLALIGFMVNIRAVAVNIQNYTSNYEP